MEPERSPGDVIRLYLLDDHEVVREGLRRMLSRERDFEVVGESGSAQEASRRIPALHPHVALLDGRLEDGSGIDVCRDVRSIDPSIACVILTSYDDEDALVASVVAGAAGYLLKQIRGTDLIAQIRRVAAGESLLDPSVRKRVRDRFREDQPSDPRLASLTEQERRVLNLIAEGMTNRQIGERLFLAEKTVKNYVSTILAKLGMERRTQAALFASQHRQRRPY